MGFDTSSSDSSAGGTGQFSQNVFNPGAYANMQGQFGGMFPQTLQGIQQQIPGAVGGMTDIQQQAMPAWQQQLQGGAYSDIDTGGMLSQSLQQSMQDPSAMQDINQMIMGGTGNNYVDAMQRQIRENEMQTLGEGLGMEDLRAGMHGQGGSSRHGIVQKGMYDDAFDRIGDINTRLGYETFDTDLNRKLQIAQQADIGTLERQKLMSGMLGGQQQAMQGGLNFGQGMQNLNMGQFAPQMMPWQAAGAYANAMGAPTVLGQGGTSSFSDSSSKGGGASMGK